MEIFVPSPVESTPLNKTLKWSVGLFSKSLAWSHRIQSRPSSTLLSFRWWSLALSTQTRHILIIWHLEETIRSNHLLGRFINASWSLAKITTISGRVNMLTTRALSKHPKMKAWLQAPLKNRHSLGMLSSPRAGSDLHSTARKGWHSILSLC